MVTEDVSIMVDEVDTAQYAGSANYRAFHSRSSFGTLPRRVVTAKNDETCMLLITKEYENEEETKKLEACYQNEDTIYEKLKLHH